MFGVINGEILIVDKGGLLNGWLIGEGIVGGDGIGFWECWLDIDSCELYFGWFVFEMVFFRSLWWIFVILLIVKLIFVGLFFVVKDLKFFLLFMSCMEVFMIFKLFSGIIWNLIFLVFFIESFVFKVLWWIIILLFCFVLGFLTLFCFEIFVLVLFLVCIWCIFFVCDVLRELNIFFFWLCLVFRILKGLFFWFLLLK